MTCLLPLLLVLMPSANPADPVVLPADSSFRSLITKGHHVELLTVKEAWFDGGGHTFCQQRSKTMCATKVIVEAANPSNVGVLCTETSTASVR